MFVGSDSERSSAGNLSFSFPFPLVVTVDSLVEDEEGSATALEELAEADADDAAGPSKGGSALRKRIRSSMHRYTAPDTPSKMRRRSSMLSRVSTSRCASCSLVSVGGSCDGS